MFFSAGFDLKFLNELAATTVGTSNRRHCDSHDIAHPTAAHRQAMITATKASRSHAESRKIDGRTVTG